ncbi:MAG: hypothetical protein ACLFVC_01440 [Opitutales bacterium]
MRFRPPSHRAHITALLCALALAVPALRAAADPAGTRKPELGPAPSFQTIEKRWNPRKKTYGFFQRSMRGSERILRGDARGAFLSENQADYPEPESGCGPTALLNLYIWYSKFGLLDESVRHSDLRQYKQLKFREIDQRMRALQKRSRTESGGTNTLEQIIVFDELLQSGSRKPLRLHFEIHRPPLATPDFIRLSRNYRAGLLSVRPKNPQTGRIEPHHAVLVIRADTTGKITVANWGRFVHGRLRMRDDGQWFVPDDPTQHELRINHLTTLIPFTPMK